MTILKHTAAIVVDTVRTVWSLQMSQSHSVSPVKLNKVFGVWE